MAKKRKKASAKTKAKKAPKPTPWKLKGRKKAFSGLLLATMKFGKGRVAIFSVPKSFKAA